MGQSHTGIIKGAAGGKTGKDNSIQEWREEERRRDKFVVGEKGERKKGLLWDSPMYRLEGPFLFYKYKLEIKQVK